MRSDVRIGIAIGLVIILGVVVYFIFSNRPDKPVEVASKTQPAPPAPWKIEIGRPPQGRQTTLAPGTDKPREGSIDAAIAADADKNKSVVPPVGPAKTEVALVGPAKTETVAVGPAKTEVKPDLWSAVKPDVKTEIKPMPVVDPVESQMRKEYDQDGAVGLRGGAPEPAKTSADPGAATVRDIELALGGEAKNGVIKTETARREPPRLDPPKVEPLKVATVGVAKSGLEDPIGKIVDTEAAKIGDNASEAVRKGEYTVKAGDNAYGIAKAVYGDVKLGGAIEKANPGVNWKRLKVGDKIKIPPPPTKAAPVVAPGTGVGVSSVADAGKYTVKAGDMGEKISKTVYGDSKSWSLIEKANPGVDATKLKVGMVLTIPAKPGATGPAGGTSATGASSVAGGSSATGGDSSKYTVKEGDTGEKISKAVYGSSKYWLLIEKANPGLNDRRLKVGQVLTIPPKPAGATAPASDAGIAPIGKAAARRAAAAAAEAAEKAPVAKKTVAKKTVSEPKSTSEAGSTEMEPASAGSGGGNGFD